MITIFRRNGMRTILLTIWITCAILVAVYNVVEDNSIDCGGTYFIGRLLNTLIWCMFLAAYAV